MIKSVTIEHKINPSSLNDELKNGILKIIEWNKKQIPDTCSVKMYKGYVLISDFESGCYGFAIKYEELYNLLESGVQMMGMVKGLKLVDDQLYLIVEIRYQ